MNGRRIERVLIAARGGEGMAILAAVEAGGREGVLLMREEDARQAWIDEVLYAVHVPAAEDGSWPDWDGVASAALDAGCDAILPVLPELASHVGFSERLISMNVLELGPGAEGLRQAADLVGLLERGRALGMRVVPALDLPEAPDAARAEARAWLDRWGGPVWLRTRAPDGAVRTRRCASVEAAVEAVEEALGAGRLTLLHTPPMARVIEVPVLGDGLGGALTVGEREITLARAGEPALIEAPAADLSPELRAALHEDARRLVAELRWRAAGAVVFAVTADGRAFLRELRPGLGVGRPVTEAVYGLDLVGALIELGEAGALPCAQEEVVADGAALGARLTVEAVSPVAVEPVADQGPRPEEEEELGEDERGIALAWARLPEDVSVAIALVAGDHVQLGEDLGLVTARAPTRQSCIVRAKTALDQLELGGVATTGALLVEILSDPAYWRGPTGQDL